MNDSRPSPFATRTHAPAGGAFARQPLSGWKVFFIALAAALIVAIVVPIFLTLFVMGAIGNAVADAENRATTVEAGSILEIDLRTPLSDTPVPDLFGTGSPSVSHVTRSLRAAVDDDRIEGVFVRVGFSGMAPATAEAVADALMDFKADGKFVIAHAQGLENPSLTAYAPIAPAEIWVQEGTAVSVAGLRTEADYYRGTFDKLGVQPEFQQFYEYKSAADTYDETGMTEPVREATEAWLGSVFDELVADIAAQRERLSDTGVRAVLDAAPHSPEEALDAGLIDRIGYLKDARDHARELAGDDDAAFVSIDDYEPQKAGADAPLIALISGQGPIVPGSSTTNPLSGSPVFGSDTIAKAFDKAAEDENIEAIVFRVSSPGGSAAASAQIDAALRRAQDAGKPVIVSMGNYAASGGYYVSANADHIVAEPTTITGSIGVLGGKLALEDAFEKIGYNVDNVEVGGPYAGAFSIDTPFTPEQETGFRRNLERIYTDFTTLVAEGRDMSIQDVREVAKGRVWTGAQAHELGLVDELGGLDVAFAKALELIEDDSEDYRIRILPREPTFEEQLARLFQVQAETQAELAQLRALMATPEVQALLKARDAAEPRTELRAILPRID